MPRFPSAQLWRIWLKRPGFVQQSIGLKASALRRESLDKHSAFLKAHWSRHTAAQPAPRRVRHKIVTNGFSLYENGFYDIESLKLADRSMLTSEPLSIKLGIALKIVEKISDL